MTGLVWKTTPWVTATSCISKNFYYTYYYYYSVITPNESIPDNLFCVLFSVFFRVLMLKQLKLSWGKMLEVYIATDSATDSINLRHCSKAMLPKSLNFVLACSAGVLFGGVNGFLAKAPRWISKSATLNLEKRGENGANQKERGSGGGGKGEGREKKKNACPKTLLKWETPPNW